MADNFLLLVLLTFLFFPVAIAVHELGHAVIARLIGRQVFTVGIGFHRFLVHFKIGQTCFYVGRPLLMGLCTSYADNMLERPYRNASYLAGGVFFTLLATAAVACLWHAGMRHITVAALFYSFLFATISNLIPTKITIGKHQISNDATKLIHCLRHTSQLDGTPGETIVGAETLGTLFRSLDVYRGVVLSSLQLALLRSALCDVDGAKEMLDDPSLADPRRGDWLRPLEAATRAVVANAEDEASSLDEIRSAQPQCGDQPRLLFLLKVAEGRAIAAAGGNGRPTIEASLRVASQMQSGPLETMAEAELLMIDPPNDAYQAGQHLLERAGNRAMIPLQKAQLAGFLAKHLAEQGNRDKSLAMTAVSKTHIQGIARAITNEQTRECFLAAYLKPLNEAAAILDQPAVSIDLEGAETEADRQSQLRKARKNAVLSMAFALLAVIVGVGPPLCSMTVVKMLGWTAWWHSIFSAALFISSISAIVLAAMGIVAGRRAQKQPGMTRYAGYVGRVVNSVFIGVAIGGLITVVKLLCK